MSATIHIPTPLREYASDQTEVPVNATTVGQALAQLVDRYPQLRPHLYTDDGTLRNFVNVYLNDDAVRYIGGDDAAVRDGDTITIVPSVAGGLESPGSYVRERRTDRAIGYDVSRDSLRWAGGDRDPDALDAGECAQREPGREGADERRRPIEPDQASTDGLGQPHVTHPDTCQSPEVGADHDVDRETGILEAEVDLPPLEHEPPTSRATHGRRHAAEVEAHDDPLRGQRFQVHTSVDVPHEQARVQVTATDLRTGPPLAPLAEALDKRPQLLTSRGEVVFAPAATRPGHAPDDAGVLELLETSGEECARHQGHTPVEVVEATAPAEQLAQDERGPSLGDDLGRLGDRAELAVPLHLSRTPSSCLDGTEARRA